MTRCAGCDKDNLDGFRFCPNCGNPIAPEPATRVRKVATLVFCDDTGSTAMGEGRDPEAVREVMDRYFAAMSSRAS